MKTTKQIRNLKFMFNHHFHRSRSSINAYNIIAEKSIPTRNDKKCSFHIRDAYLGDGLKKTTKSCER